jgi:hypothetical protein
MFYFLGPTQILSLKCDFILNVGIVTMLYLTAPVLFLLQLEFCICGSVGCGPLYVRPSVQFGNCGIKRAG